MKSLIFSILLLTLHLPQIICSGANFGLPDNGCQGITSSGKCINYVNNAIGINWENSKALCTAPQTIASISSSEENDVLYSLTDVSTGYVDCWIGFNDIITENSFGWVDDSSVSYTNWGYGQPNEGSGDEDCVQITPDSYWYDISCEDIKHCLFCSSEVDRFGRVDPEVGLGDFTILTKDTTLYCIEEGTYSLTWRSTFIGGYSDIIIIPTPNTHGESELDIRWMSRATICVRLR
ncbi:Mannose-binding protein C [Oopsacas minuta]|uniref:Mannose-binding protein C n=1 Tax=Oopsacas minuta TaxID=111878 RepID=A0AAV7JCT6_9METZ|nr:Mannose-binding protein C [Oopsacas minuta]